MAKGWRWRRGVRRLALAVGFLVVLGLGVRWLLFHGPVRAPEPLPVGLIVDGHVHVAGLGHGGSGCFVSPALRDSFRFGRYLAAFGVTEARLEEEGDQAVFAVLAARVRASRLVDRAVVLALDGVIGPDGELDRSATEVYVPDDFVASQTARYDELLYGASVNPYRRDALARLEQAKARGAVLVKWLPAIQHVDPADPALVPYYRKLVELDLPLLTHAGQERSFTTSRDELSDPARLRLPLEQGVRVIAAHVASTGRNEGEDNVDRLLALMAEFDNLVADISSLTQVNKLGYLDRVLLEPALEGRLLYASDYPLTNTLLVSPWYFPLHLDARVMAEVAAEDNVFDRDVHLKQALGVPAAVFLETGRYLGLR